MTETKQPAPAKTETKQPAPAASALPSGHEQCFVALPDKVHGENGRCKPGAKITCPSSVIDDLEMRGLAFRDEAEARAEFTKFKRKKEAELKERAEALRKKEERRLQWKQELEKGVDLEWQE